jgi:hypothetical protein
MAKTQLDRKLLSDLNRCGWESLKAYSSLASGNSTAVPGAAIGNRELGMRV